jgi:hypothetical protein
VASLPDGYRSQLIATGAEDVPADVAATFRELCAAWPGVDAGFACRQRIAVGDTALEERLALAVHLAVGQRSHDERLQVVRAFAQALPKESLAFVEDVALPAWRGFGVQLY